MISFFSVYDEINSKKISIEYRGIKYKRAITEGLINCSILSYLKTGSSN